MKKLIFILILLSLLSPILALAAIEGPDASGKCYDGTNYTPGPGGGIISTKKEVPCPAGTPTPPATSAKLCIYDDTYGEINGQKDPKTATNYPCVNAASTNYELLTPLPCPDETLGGCERDASGKLVLKTIDVGGENALGQYLNIIIKLAIGIAAVLAVVLIVMGVIQYMSTELVSGKEEGKKRITNAVLGLLVALGAWLILYTINPNLLSTTLVIPKTQISYFEVSGAQVRTPGGPPIRVSFRAEAYPAASAASQATGVDPAFILAIFAQETNSGKNTGGCLPANANMYPEDMAALATIVGSGNVSNTNVSCASGGGRGGAIGLMQFRPTTWLATRDTPTRDPWNINDALMVGAILLKQNGAINDPRNAACKYYSGSPCTPGRTPPNVFYGDEVMAKMASIRQQIDEWAASVGGRF